MQSRTNAYVSWSPDPACGVCSAICEPDLQVQTKIAPISLGEGASSGEW